jgi:hypothetical protein
MSEGTQQDRDAIEAWRRDFNRGGAPSESAVRRANPAVQMAAKTEFERRRRGVITTFITPRWVITRPEQDDPLPAVVPTRLPFRSLRIIEAFEAPIIPGAETRVSGVSEFLCVEDEAEPGLLLFFEKVHYIDGPLAGLTYFLPVDLDDLNSGADAVYGVLRLLDALENRANRYIEQPVSRPQRRALGVAPDYREYIIVPPERTPRYETAIKRADMQKRLVALHAVRGHLRRLSSGRVVPVRPHTRGNLGTGVQVKDYRIGGSS